MESTLWGKSGIQRTLLAHSELFSLVMVFGPGLGSALLLLGVVFWVGRDLLGQGRL